MHPVTVCLVKTAVKLNLLMTSVALLPKKKKKKSEIELTAGVVENKSEILVRQNKEEFNFFQGNLLLQSHEQYKHKQIT